MLHPVFVAEGWIVTRDEDLLLQARALARGIVEEDPELEGAEHARMRELLEKRHRERLEMWRVG